MDITAGQGKVVDKFLRLNILVWHFNLMCQSTESQWSCFGRWREDEPGGQFGTTTLAAQF